MPHLSIALLGTIHVTLDGEPVTDFKSDKVRALLAYLAVEADRTHRRDALAGLLWPEQSNRDARSNLRYTLYDLRKVIDDHTAKPPFLLVTRNTIRFNTASDHSLDVAALARRIAGSRDHSFDDEGAKAAHRNLQSTLELYRGPFLAGFSVSDCPAFEEWALFKREQIDHQVADALHRLATIHERRGAYVQAQACVRRHLELEPWNEGAHRQLMRVLALNGQRAAALAQYEMCRRLLADDLDIEPEMETRALYQKIHDGNLKVPRASGQEDRRATPTMPSRTADEERTTEAAPTAFVERDRELARLDDLLDAALAGQGGAVFVVGDAGAGKTALINAFTQRTLTAHPDVVVARGHCNAHTGVGDPYLPFREILQLLTGDVEAQRSGGTIGYEAARRLWRALPDAVQALVDEGPDLIDRLVPGAALALRAEAFAPAGTTWRERLEAIVGQNAHRRDGDERGSGTATDLDQALSKQVNLLEQVTRVLLALARYHPLVLVLEDLQWADAGSTSLLFHLGRRLAGGRILIVGAYRPGDLARGRNGERHPLAPVIHELQRDRGDVQIDLGQANDRRFVEALVDSEPHRLGAAFCETLYRHTGGNPLFTVELLRGLRERGDLVRDEDGRWVEGPSLEWGRLPARVEAVIAERVGRLPPAWQAALATASVEGETFTAEVVARVQDVDPSEILRLLSDVLGRQHRLVRAQSLHRVGAQRLSRYRFRHFVFQRYLYHQLDEVERAYLHEAVGNTLEALYGEHGDETTVAIAGQLAWHFERAGLVDQAVTYRYRAGERAVQMSAYEEALLHYTRGLELLETMPDSADRARRELSFQLALGIPLRAIKSYGAPERGRAYTRALELSRQIGEPAQIFQSLIMHWSYCMPRAEHRQALGIAEQILDLAQRMGEPAQTAAPHTVLGISQVYLGKFTQARAHFERALADFDPHQRRSLLTVTGQDIQVTCLAYLSWTLWFLGYPDQALQRADESIKLAHGLNQPFSLGFALGIAGGVIHLRCGKYDLALEEAETLLRLWEEQGFTLYQAWGQCIKGRALTELGHADEGLAILREGVAACRAAGILASHTQQLANFAEACASAGAIDEGLDAIDEALALVEAHDERHFEANLHLRRGELLLQKGRTYWSEAEECLHRAIEVACQQRARSWELRAAAVLGHLHREQGQHEEAYQRLADVLGQFTEGFDTVDLQQARALLEKLGVFYTSPPLHWPG